MKKRFAMLTAGLLAAALVTAGVAVAEGALTLTASKTAVTYPHGVTLTVGLPSAEVTSAAVLALPAGASEWTTKCAEVTETVKVAPRVTTAYKAVAGAYESEPVTVSVAAALTKPEIRKGHWAARAIRVKGQVRPGHKDPATVTVALYRSEVPAKNKGKKGPSVWVLHSSKVVDLTYYRSRNMSSWATTFTPDAKGVWKVVVSHEDAGHVYSQADRKFFLKK